MINDHINIVMITPSYIPDYSGYSKQAHQINRLLSKNNNINIKVIPKRSHIDYTDVDGVKIIHLLSYKLKKLHKMKIIRELIWVFQVIKYLFKNRKEIDVIHILGDGPSTLVFSLLSKILKKPIIVKKVISNAETDKTVKNTLKNFILKHFTYTIAISNDIFDYLISRGFKKNKVIYIPNGVNTDKYRPASDHHTKMQLRRKLMLKENNFIAVHVGLNDKRKGIDILVKSWEKFLYNNKEATLLLIGPSKDQLFHEWLVDYLEKRNLKGKVFILGSISNVDKYLKASDIFLFPSEREGLPNALMEAMACGLPCIARDIGGVSDLIENGLNGFLCKSEQESLVTQFSQQILYIYNNKEGANEGLNARNKMLEEFSIYEVAEKYKNTYKNLAKVKK